MGGRYPFRFRVGDAPRRRVDVAASSPEDAALRADRLRKMVAALVQAGRDAQAAVLLDAAAAESGARAFADIERAGYDLASTPLGAPVDMVTPTVTYRQIVTGWLSGDYHKRWRSEVPFKSPESVGQDWSIYTSHILPVLGERPIATLGLDDAEAVKQALSGQSYRDNTFSRYCRLIRRPFVLAEYPLRLIERNPVPAKFVPAPGKARERTYLYPGESDAFLAAEDIDLVDRLLWGYSERNGSRPGEAIALEYGDVDFANGTITLDHNKTRSPRQWKAELDVLEMLWLIRPSDDTDPATLVFGDFNRSHWARRFKQHLGSLGLERRELLTPKDPAVRKAIVAHDGRATFVTRALANRDDRGRPTHRADEYWVRDRTGHTTSREMERYRRQARFAEEHSHTRWFTPLWQAIPELGRLKELAQQRVGQQVGQSSRASIKTPASLFPLREDRESSEPLQAHKDGVIVAPPALWLPPGPPQTGGVGQTQEDPDQPLKLALERATAAERWQLAEQLSAELRERRHARSSPDITSLDSARRRRGK